MAIGTVLIYNYSILLNILHVNPARDFLIDLGVVQIQIYNLFHLKLFNAGIFTTGLSLWYNIFHNAAKVQISGAVVVAFAVTLV